MTKPTSSLASVPNDLRPCCAGSGSGHKSRDPYPPPSRNASTCLPRRPLATGWRAGPTRARFEQPLPVERPERRGRAQLPGPPGRVVRPVPNRRGAPASPSSAASARASRTALGRRPARRLVGRVPLRLGQVFDLGLGVRVVGQPLVHPDPLACRRQRRASARRAAPRLEEAGHGAHLGPLVAAADLEAPFDQHHADSVPGPAQSGAYISSR